MLTALLLLAACSDCPDTTVRERVYAGGTVELTVGGLSAGDGPMMTLGSAPGWALEDVDDARDTRVPGGAVVEDADTGELSWGAVCVVPDVPRGRECQGVTICAEWSAHGADVVSRGADEVDSTKSAAPRGGAPPPGQSGTIRFTHLDWGNKAECAPELVVARWNFFAPVDRQTTIQGLCVYM